MMEDTNRTIHNEECDDSDMKIVGAGTTPAYDCAAESEALEKYDQLRRSGELAKARRLGAFLAAHIEEINGEPECALGEKIGLHRRLMIIFASVAAMERELPERILVQTALNVFYDTLKKDSPGLYDSMSASGAITFYYLEYRKLGRMPADIGGAFAMLCGREEDAVLIEMGSGLFARAFDYVCSVIQNVGFDQSIQ